MDLSLAIDFAYIPLGGREKAKKIILFFLLYSKRIFLPYEMVEEILSLFVTLFADTIPRPGYRRNAVFLSQMPALGLTPEQKKARRRRRRNQFIN